MHILKHRLSDCGLVYVSYSGTSLKCICENSVQLKTAVFWDVVSCSLLELYQHSEAWYTSNMNLEDWGSIFLQYVCTLLSNYMALYHTIVCNHWFQNLRPLCVGHLILWPSGMWSSKEGGSWFLWNFDCGCNIPIQEPQISNICLYVYIPHLLEHKTIFHLTSSVKLGVAL
jgi:hypothetical protein